MNHLRNHFLRLLAILFISASLSSCGSKPEKTADHFMSLLVAGKHLEAQDMLGKDMRSMAGMLGGLKPYYRSGAFTSYTLTQLEMTDKSVSYRVDAITSAGQRYSDFMDLTREDGEWKVSMF